MRTVFVTLPPGLLVRNILFTGVLNKLAARGDIRVVVFTNVPDIAERYPHPGDDLVFEPFPQQARYTLKNVLNRMLSVRFYKMNENRSLKSKRRTLRRAKPWIYLLETLLSQPFPRSRMLYRRLSALAAGGSVSDRVRSLFAYYRPSLMFATHPTRMFEYDFLSHARKTGVTSVGMIMSWDVPTTKGHISAPADHYLVWNRIMKADLMRLFDLSDDQVSVTGIPQFDIYSEPIDPSQREVFLRGQGLDPNKKTVLFSTSPPWINMEEPEILKRLATALEARGTGTVQILARLHPREDPRRYEGIQYPNLRFQIPTSEPGDAWLLDLDQSFLPQLRDTINSSDVVINTASTMTIDAVALDRPVINISFDLEPKNYSRSCRRFYDFDHYRPVVDSGAAKIATSFEEMVDSIFRYLHNPESERHQRTHLRETMCYRVDGGSAQRIADILHGILNQKLLVPTQAQA